MAVLTLPVRPVAHHARDIANADFILAIIRACALAEEWDRINPTPTGQMIRKSQAEYAALGAKRADRASWAMRWNVRAVLAGYPNEVAEGRVTGDYPNMPEKVVMAKFKRLERKGLVSGCDCGCRGDWTLTLRTAVALGLNPGDPGVDWFSAEDWAKARAEAAA